MKTNIIYLTCAIVAGTHLANIGEAQVTTENSGTTGAVYAMTNDHRITGFWSIIETAMASSVLAARFPLAEEVPVE